MGTRLELVTGRGTGVGTLAGKVLRPARPDDAPRLVAMFERCSLATRYSRFLSPLHHFPASHLVDVVKSSRTRRSWVIEDLGSGEVVGVGSWFRNEPDAAEVAILIEDAFQHRGLGTALLDELAATACAAGITTFVGHTLADARRTQRLLRRLGPTTIEGGGTVRTLRTCLDDGAVRESRCRFA